MSTRVDIPDPDNLKADINTLESKVDSIRKRRGERKHMIEWHPIATGCRELSAMRLTAGHEY